MDIQAILNNETVKSTLNQIGVSQEQQEQIVQQAYELVQKRASNEPSQLSSLLSENPNTDDDNNFQAGMQGEFLNDLIKKVGLPEGAAGQVAAFLPMLLKNIDLNSILSIIGSLTSDNTEQKNTTTTNSGGGIFSFLGMIGKLFKR